MGEARGRPVGDAFEGESRFVSDSNRASLEEALEAAAEAASRSLDESIRAGDADKSAYDRTYDVDIQVEVREHNQHVKVYRVRITPGG